MSEKEFDKIFRDKLENLSSTVPEDMWQRIQGEKDKDRKVFFLPPWLLVAAMLILIVSVWVVVKNSNNSMKGNARVINKEENASNKQSNFDNNANEKSVTNSESANGKSENEMADHSDHESANTKIIAGSINRNYQNQNQKSIEENYTQENNGLINSRKQPSSQLNSNTPSSIGNILENAVKDFPVDSSKLTAKQEPKKDSAIAQVLDENDKEEKKHEEDDNEDLTLEIFAAPEWPVISTSPNYNSGYSATTQSYVAQKKSSESTKISFSFGLNLSKKFGKHFSVKTGFRYLRINQEFSYSKFENRYVPFIGNRFATDINGNVISVTDTLSMLTSGYRKISSLNAFKMFSIPLLVSYQTGGRNLKLAFTAGPVVNVYTVFDGKTLDPYTFSAIPINSGNIYRTRSGVGVYAGISATKNVFGDFQVFAEPHIQYNFKEITQPSAPFKQKIHTTGISVGVKYNFINRQR